MFSVPSVVLLRVRTYEFSFFLRFCVLQSNFCRLILLPFFVNELTRLLGAAATTLIPLLIPDSSYFQSVQSFSSIDASFFSSHGWWNEGMQVRIVYNIGYLLYLYSNTSKRSVLLFNFLPLDLQIDLIYRFSTRTCFHIAQYSFSIMHDCIHSSNYHRINSNKIQRHSQET